MKIGIVLSKTPSYSETFFTSKIKGLQNYGHEVLLFVQQKSDDFDGCTVIQSPYTGKRKLILLSHFLKVFFKLLFYIRPVYRFVQLERKDHRSDFQIIKNIYNNSHLLTKQLDWLHFGFATMALQSEHVAKAIGSKMAISFRGYDIAIYPLKHKNCYHLLWEHVDKIHTISNDLIALAYEHGLPKNVVYEKITPAIDVLKFQNLSESKEGHILNFVTVARLHWKKGLISTLEALALIKDKLPKFSYTIIGTGEIYQELAYAIHQLHLSDQVHLVGQKRPNEVAQILSSSNLYLQYSISEGFSNALLEAQASGLLCIASDAEGLTENVLDGVTGWIVKKNNPILLANKILEVVNLPTSEKAKITIAAKERIRKQFNLEQQQEAFNSFYN